MVVHRSLRLCSLFLNLFSVPQAWKFPLSYLPICWFILLLDRICLWIPLVNFSFTLCTSHLQNFFVVSFCVFSSSLFPLHSHIVFLTFSSSPFSFFFPNIFKMIMSKSLSNRYASFCLYFFWVGHTFFFFCLVIFFVENWTFESRI